MQTSIEDIAADFSVTPLVVQRRLKLAKALLAHIHELSHVTVEVQQATT